MANKQTLKKDFLFSLPRKKNVLYTVVKDTQPRLTQTTKAPKLTISCPISVNKASIEKNTSHATYPLNHLDSMVKKHYMLFGT